MTNFKNTIIASAMGTKSHQWIAYMFYSEKDINRVMAAETYIPFDEDTDLSAITIDTSERKNYDNAFIITESVFSMDGDIAPLKKIVELKKKYNCIMIVDEAHAFGVFGNKGLGVAETFGITNDIDLIIGTFGKAIGSVGAFVTGSKILIDFLINKSRSFIFSTAIPPINVAFTKWIIENKLPLVSEKRKKMLATGKKFGSQSHIIPVIVGENQETVDLCEVLFHNGYFTLPIRPPTVPAGTSRIRLSLTCEIEENELDKLKECINESKLAVQTR